MVMFHNSGSFMVPWSKKKFKQKIEEFKKTVAAPVVIKKVKKKSV